MSVDLDLVVRAPLTVLGLVIGLVAIKSVVLTASRGSRARAAGRR